MTARHHGRMRLRRSHPKPETFDDLVLVTEAERSRTTVVAAGVAVLVVALPFVTWLAVTIGERARETNCQDIRKGFDDYTTELAHVFQTDPNGPVTQAFRARIAADLKDCH